MGLGLFWVYGFHFSSRALLNNCTTGLFIEAQNKIITLNDKRKGKSVQNRSGLVIKMLTTNEE